MKNLRERVIVALDYNRLDSVKGLLEKLDGNAYFYKVGSELFTSCGHESIKLIKAHGCKIFLDLKFHDIPNTVYNAVKSAGELGVNIINVHALGGVDMMEAAKNGGLEASYKTGNKIDIIAVTILTNLSEKDLRAIFYDIDNDNDSDRDKPDYNLKYLKFSKEKGEKYENIVGKTALHLAKLAKNSGLDGVVCSGYESLEIKSSLGGDFKTVTPGIRLKRGNDDKEKRGQNIGGESGGIQIDDQKRVMTPSGAFNAKADYIVVGREITAADDPLGALNAIYDDIERFYRG